MLLGLISLLLGQWGRWISQICVNSSLFSSKFYLCSEEDYGKGENERVLFTKTDTFSNETEIPSGLNYPTSHQCGKVKCHFFILLVTLMEYCIKTKIKFQGREPFVSYEGLEQLHRFLFVLGFIHVLYSCITVGLAMSKVCFFLFYII